MSETAEPSDFEVLLLNMCTIKKYIFIKSTLSGNKGRIKVTHHIAQTFNRFLRTITEY